MHGPRKSYTGCLRLNYSQTNETICLQASLTLNETAPNSNIDGDIPSLQNLQAIHALKYLQQQPPLINHLLPSAANNNIDVKLCHYMWMRL